MKPQGVTIEEAIGVRTYSIPCAESLRTVRANADAIFLDAREIDPWVFRKYWEVHAVNFSSYADLYCS